MVVLHRLRHFYQGIHIHPGPFRAGWRRERFLQEARGSRILVYHGLCRSDPFRFNHLFISARKFEVQLKLFRKYFQIVSLEQYFAGDFSAQRFNVCLTFDDGFANNHEFVLPLLEKYGVPAAFFITGIRKAGYSILWNDFLSILQRLGPQKIRFQNELYIKNRNNQYIQSDSGIPLESELRKSDFPLKAQLIKELCSLISWDRERNYWLQLSEEEIRKLSQSPLCTIGSHGFYHNDLSLLEPDLALSELKESRCYLEHLIGKPVNALAFPYGSYTPSLLKKAMDLGYTQLLATDYRSPADARHPFLKERLTINPFLAPEQQLFATIKGGYDY
jgi:peptidoglycan/xylan/chitin deacetylase (PgdA/CDA1 family)